MEVATVASQMFPTTRMKFPPSFASRVSPPSSSLQLALSNSFISPSVVDSVSADCPGHRIRTDSLYRYKPSESRGKRDVVIMVHESRKYSLKASKTGGLLEGDNGNEKGGGESGASRKADDIFDMDYEERMEWRSKIRKALSKVPDVEEEVDPDERRKKIQKLLADYPLVVEEDDPDWPEDADGWGFNLDQFFNKITIKNVKKDDDENYGSENEIVWQDDNYIRPIRDITSAEWEEAVFKDISPLVVLMHNRYKRPKENEKIRDELEKAVHIIWNCRLPSPRCVAIDAVVETDLVSALQVSVFPELIFTKAGKILYREKAIRNADELSKMMAFYYYGAVKPPCLSDKKMPEEDIPSFSRTS